MCPVALQPMGNALGGPAPGVQGEKGGEDDEDDEGEKGVQRTALCPHPRPPSPLQMESGLLHLPTGTIHTLKLYGKQPLREFVITAPKA